MFSSTGADEAALQKSYTDAPSIDIATAEQLLLEAQQIMDQFDVPFFLRQGTCLGAIRDNALIAWDDDMDIGSIYGLNGVTKKKIEDVASAFRDNGYYAKVEDGDQYVSVTMMKSSTRIDWSCYKVIGDIIFHYPGVRIPAALFDQLKEIDFIGSTFLVPNPPEEYLALKYGPEWMTPKKTGFEKDVLDLISDTPLPGRMGKIKLFLGKYHLRWGAGKLRVLDKDGNPASGAEVRIAAVGNYLTDEFGYAEFHLPKDDWYALVIKHNNHEEVLYQEKMATGTTYTYKQDPSTVSGRLCTLSSESTSRE